MVFEPVPVKSSAVPSSLFLTESEGNPGEIVATLGFLDGREFPKKSKQKWIFLPRVRVSVKAIDSN